MKVCFILFSCIAFFINVSSAKSYSYNNNEDPDPFKLTMKINAIQTTTTNANLTNTNAINDKYTTYDISAQEKNRILKYKIRYRADRYSKESPNNSDLIEFYFQYKEQKVFELGLILSELIYPNTPKIVSDTNTDYHGAKVVYNKNVELNSKTLGYFGLNISYKDYTKSNVRTDMNYVGIMGLDHYLTDKVALNPETSITYNGSNARDYSYAAYGGSLYLTFNPEEEWEIYSGASIYKTLYSSRQLPTAKFLEQQELYALEVGSTYSFHDVINIAIRYASQHNSSNNTNKAYKNSLLSLTLGVKL